MALQSNAAPFPTGRAQTLNQPWLQSNRWSESQKLLNILYIFPDSIAFKTFCELEFARFSIDSNSENHIPYWSSIISETCFSQFGFKRWDMEVILLTNIMRMYIPVPCKKNCKKWAFHCYECETWGGQLNIAKASEAYIYGLYIQLHCGHS